MLIQFGAFVDRVRSDMTSVKPNQTSPAQSSTPNSSSRLRIVVLGYLVRGPIGGMAWHHLQYVLGLHELGHDVRFVEDSDDYPSCYDPERGVVDENPAYGLRFAAEAFDR